MHLFNSTVSFLNSKTSLKLTEGNLELSDFTNPRVLHLQKREDGTFLEKDGKAFMSARFADKRRSSSCPVIENTMLVFDIDEIADKQDFIDSLNLLKKDNIEYIYHSTSSHTPEKMRFRLLIPLLKPISPDEFRGLSEAVSDRYRLGADPASFKPAQIMFLPMVLPGHRDEYKKGKNVGAPLNPSAFSYTTREDDDMEDIFHKNSPLPVPAGVSEELWISAILDSYPPHDLGYDTDKVGAGGWIGVMMGLYHQYDGSDEGLELFLNWESANGTNPKAEEFGRAYRVKRWKSCKAQPGVKPLTMKSVANKKPENGPSILSMAYAKVIKLTNDNDALDRIFEFASNDPYIKYAKETAAVVKAYQEKKTTLGVETKSKVALQHMLGGMNTDDDVGDEEAHYFFNRYLQKKDGTTLIDMRNPNTTEDPLSIRAFNNKYQKSMPVKSPNGMRFKPMDVLTSGLFKYIDMRFLGETFYEVNGPAYTQCPFDAATVDRNLYIQGSWPVVETPFDEDDELDAAIGAMIESHITYISGGDPIAVKGLTQWLANTRQNPHSRAEWVPALLGVGGAGKSMFKTLAQTVLGKAQMGSTNANVVNSSFNKYAGEPVLITTIDEVEGDAGRNFGLDNLKELVTGTLVPINAKGISEKTMKVYTQFLVIANRENVLGAEAKERRWMPVTPSVNHRETIGEVLGEEYVVGHTLKKQIASLNKFYGKYIDLMNNHADRFAAYFESVDLSDFDTNSVPTTATKEDKKGVDIEALTRARINEVIDDALVVHRPDLARDLLLLATDMENNYDDDEFVEVFSATSRVPKRRKTQLIEVSLKMLGYVQAARIGADSQSKRWKGLFAGQRDKVRVCNVWYKNVPELDGIKWTANDESAKATITDYVERVMTKDAVSEDEL